MNQAQVSRLVVDGFYGRSFRATLSLYLIALGISAVVGIVIALVAGRATALGAASDIGIALVVAVGVWAIGHREDAAVSFERTTTRTNIWILDTSAITDGRVADICETGFIRGTLVIPAFVLKNIQHIADSPDSLERNRGRHALEVLQKIRKMSWLNMNISEVDFPEIEEVPFKILELAKVQSGAIMTADFNSHKVAQLQGVPAVNIHDLANAMRPVTLPGEFMRVFILKEGKEYNQGVAYLDDGTMVIVDNASKLIGKNVDITVTSVLQTSAGKMIFGKAIEGKQATSAHGSGA